MRLLIVALLLAISYAQTEQGNCCRALTAECLACQAGVPEEAYCAVNPWTVGCHQVTSAEPVKDEAEEASCCRALTAECLACQFGVTEEQYCAINPGAVGCYQLTSAQPKDDSEGRICCRALTAECLACSDGVTVDEYCAINPNTVGCTFATEEPKDLSDESFGEADCSQSPAFESSDVIGEAMRVAPDGNYLIVSGISQGGSPPISYVSYNPDDGS